MTNQPSTLPAHNLVRPHRPLTLQNIFAAALLTLAFGGCATNPVTGKNEISIISEAWELKTGRQLSSAAESISQIATLTPCS